MTRIRIAVVGLKFGEEFVPIYKHHPSVESVALCDTNPQAVERVGRKFGIRKQFSSLDDLLADRTIDAVHLVTPIPLHVQQVLATLESGKHCACAVPMATSLDDLRAIIAAQRKTRKNYMMMETAVYTREFFLAKEMQEKGEFGRISFLRGAHLQDCEGLSPYWIGLPPMWYATHAMSPLLALMKTRATKVCCFGSGRLPAEMQKQYNNPFPFETAIFQLEGTNVAAEVSRFLFKTARSFVESFAIYGDRQGFEWQQLGDENPVLFALGAPDAWGFRPVSSRRVKPPDRVDLIPPEIARFTHRLPYDSSDSNKSFLTGGGHHGSHPHLVHEFISSIVENRAPAIDAVTAANWTAPGICAHESAMKGGEPVTIPKFD